MDMEKEKLEFEHTNKPGVHPRTPNSIKFTSSSSSSLSYSNSSIISPLPKRFNAQKQMPRIRNPFENAWERLHLPIIASPSLFQRPATPQLSSTKFEWTIEDVSSLKPAHVEAHETQFQDSPDSDYEAKVQSAISSFFKEQQVVPSPINSALQQQRIILAELNGNTPITKPGRRIRDCGTQTILSLPLDLPPHLEEALRPYFQSQLVDCGGEDASDDDNVVTSNKRNNTSMRRKLFDIHNIIVLDENGESTNLSSTQPADEGPVEDKSPQTAMVESNSDSLDESSDSQKSLHNSSMASTFNDLNSFHSPTPKSTGRCSFLFKSPSAQELSPIFPTRHRVFNMHKKSEDSATERRKMKNFNTPSRSGRRSYPQLEKDGEDSITKAEELNGDANSSELMGRSGAYQNSNKQCTNFQTADNETDEMSGGEPSTSMLMRAKKREKFIDKLNGIGDYDECEVEDNEISSNCE